MNSHANDRFWKSFSLLPERIQKQAERVYGQWKVNPYHPSLHFKCIHKAKSVYSVRVGIGYRALGRRHNEDMIWFWIGTYNHVFEFYGHFSTIMANAELRGQVPLH